jgi:hypothetical protein
MTAGCPNRQRSAHSKLLDNAQIRIRRYLGNIFSSLLGRISPVCGAGKPRTVRYGTEGPSTKALPPQVLVTNDPSGKALKDVDWLIRL